MTYCLQGTIQCDSETVFELAALALHATNGDYTRFVIKLQEFAVDQLNLYYHLLPHHTLNTNQQRLDLRLNIILGLKIQPLLVGIQCMVEPYMVFWCFVSLFVVK